MEVVLEGGSSDEQAELSLHLPHNLAQGARLILDPVSFVDDQVVPLEPGQDALLLQNSFVARYEYVPFVLSGDLIGRKVLLHDATSLVLRTEEAKGANMRAPLPKLADPVPSHNFRADHNVLASDSSLKNCSCVKFKGA